MTQAKRTERLRSQCFSGRGFRSGGFASTAPPSAAAATREEENSQQNPDSGAVEDAPAIEEVEVRPDKGEGHHQQGQADQYCYTSIIFHGRRGLGSGAATKQRRRGYELLHPF